MSQASKWNPNSKYIEGKEIYLFYVSIEITAYLVKFELELFEFSI